MQGATAIYAVTDFWNPLFKALASHRPGAKEPFDVAFEDEIRQGKNIVDAANTCLDTLERFVISSLPNAVEISKGRHPLLKHYVSKATTVDYIKHLPSPADGGKSLWSITSELWPGYYMENWLMHPYLKPKKVRNARRRRLFDQTPFFFAGDCPRAEPAAQEQDASWAIMTPLPPHVPLSVMTTTDLGKFVSEILRRPLDPTHTPVLAASDTVTMPQMAEAIARNTGRKVTYKTIPPPQLEVENPGYGDELADMYAYFEEYGFAGEVKMSTAADVNDTLLLFFQTSSLTRGLQSSV